MSGAERRPAPPRAAASLGATRLAARALARTTPYRALVVLFVAVLWLPLVGMAVYPERNPQSGEARRTAPFPRIALDVAAVNEFPSAFEAYFADRLGFRSLLVRLASVIRVKYLGVSTDERVLLGKDGWLFMVMGPVPSP